MRIADWKIGTKLIVGFLAVVAILGAAIGYQILTLQNLAKLQDIGAKRAADALEIKNIVNRLDEVYGVIADGEINRNMEKTLKEFEQVKTTAQQDIGAVRGLVDTAEEKTWAETFATQYNQYLDRFEKEMLPILKKGDLTQKRFDDALAINTIARRVDAVYGVIADAVINRNMEKSLKEFEQVKAAAQQDITTVRGMVDTTEEKAWAETFAEQYNQYLNHFEKEMLPILKKGDVSRKRFDDAVAINNIGRRVEEVHGVMADAVINRDLEAARKDFEPMKVAAQQDIAAVRGLVDTAEEKTWAETFAAQYPQYLDLFEQQMLPALQKSDLSDWEAIRALDENIDRLREATLAPLNAIDQSLTRESEQAAQDAAKITTLDGEIDEMRLATVRPLNDMLKALERESLEATQDVNKVRELDAEIDTLRAAAIVPLDSINTSLTQESVDADKQFDVVRQRAVRLASILSISGCILALIIAWFITISITRPLGKIVLAANNVVQGDLTKDIPIRQRDEIGVLAESFRKMTGKVVGVLQEMERLIHAIQDGKLDQRGDIKTFDGSWRDLVAGSNNVVDALMAPFNVAVEYIDRIAKGDIPVKITDDYKGDFNEMKNNLNMLIDAMNDIAQVAEQIAIGNLNLTVRERSEHDRLMKALNVMISALDDVVKLAEEMADGNLMVEVHERSDEDKLMQALNTMIRRLNEVVTHVKSAADYVTSGSQAMSASAEEMSQGATEQASAAEEASSSMEQMAANIRQNADNASQTEKIAVKAAADATEGGRTVAETVHAMREIAKKVSIIEEIARQTRMLSLNATIEAAKAQEHGKGFAVVAAEVRALSERSQNAAEEINRLASTSVDTASKAGELLVKLVPDIQKTAELVQEISAASREQDSGTAQINRAIQQLDQVIQQNSATSEEMASTAEELSSQAEQLQETMRFFQTQETQEVSRPELKIKKDRRKNQPKAAAPKMKEETKTEGHPIDLQSGKEKGDDLDAEFERY